MPRPRSPNRDKAFEIWKGSGGKIPLKDIAEQLHVSDNQIRKWKHEDQWRTLLKSNKKKGNITKRGAPKGNKNSVGHGAPKGNKNAVTTGAYEMIWFDCLTKEEKDLCETIKTDTLTAIDEDLRLITIRERRMMERIQNITNGLSEKERKVLYELQTQKKPVEVYNELSGKSNVVVIPETKMVMSEITEIERRRIDDIIRIEEALTKVQEKKAKLLSNKHKIEYDKEKLQLDRDSFEHRKSMDEKNNW